MIRFSLLIVCLLLWPVSSQTALKSLVWNQVTTQRNFKPAKDRPSVITTRRFFAATSGAQREELISPERHTVTIRTKERTTYCDMKLKQGTFGSTTAAEKQQLSLAALTKLLAASTGTKGLRKVRQVSLFGEMCDVHQGKAAVGKGHVVLYIVAQGPLKGLVLQSYLESSQSSVETKTVELAVNGAIPSSTFQPPRGVKIIVTKEYRRPPYKKKGER